MHSGQRVISVAGSLGAAVLVAILGCTATQRSARDSVSTDELRRQAVPQDAVSAILSEFRRHQIVAVAEAHGNEQFHSFLQQLIRDPNFATVANDVIVEFGNSRYQALMDRFVQGEDVPYSELRDVWQNTTQPTHLWDLPIYEEFFRTVRAVNNELPPDRRIRVVLGDSPIDWDSVRSREDVRPFANRDRWAADVIKREVLTVRHRALIVYGGTHLLRPQGLIGLLEAEGAARVFTVWTHTQGDLRELQPGASQWPAPSLVSLTNTVLGEAAFGFYFPVSPGRPNPRMEEQFDALLYVGDPNRLTTSGVTPQLCRDSAYVRMRVRRAETIGFTFPPDAPYPDWRSTFTAGCAGKD